MESSKSRSFNNQSNAPQAFLKTANATTESQFYELLKNLMSAVNKNSSNNVAIAAITAMFFAFVILLLKPATPVANPPAINLQVHSTTTVTTNQEQSQQAEPPLPPGS